MKKTSIIIIIILCLAFSGGYFVFDSIFPKAGPISGPTQNRANKDRLIKSISLAKKDGSSVMVENEELGIVLQSIDNAKSTRKMSANDYPTVETYYTIEILSSVRVYSYFIYKENSQVYIEVPYEGIYTSSQEFYDFVEGYFNS